MHLFEIVPGNFFSILSSKNKELYVDALMLLHRLFRNELNIETEDFVAALIGLLENRAYELEADDEVVDGGLTLSAKARLIINRLVKTGWLDREQLDGSFTEVVTPRNYAIRVMKLLYDLGDTQLREYNSLVFSTYSALKEARTHQPHQMYEALLNAKSNTERLTYELKTLYHGIRAYLRKVQGQADINTLLRDHFDDYKALADRIYHPLKTMDSVYRYMTPIQEILNDLLGDSDMMDSMRKRALSVRRYESEENAGLEITTAIDYVLEVYQSIGGIVNEIDKKHSTYTKLSVDAIRYHMTADRSIKGKLVSLLRTYANSPDDQRVPLFDRMTRIIRVNRQEFLDGQSPLRKNIKSRRIPAEPLTVDAEPRLSESETRHLLAYLNDDYSLQHVKGYMDTLFGVKETVSADEIEIADDREFILLLLATLRAGERNINYKVHMGTGRQLVNGYTIPDITFTKKEGGGRHVE